MYNPREIRPNVADMSLVDLISEHSILGSVNGWVGYDNNDRWSIRMRLIDLECAIRKLGRELLTQKLERAIKNVDETQEFLIDAAAFTLWHAHNPPEPENTGNEDE